MSPPIVYTCQPQLDLTLWQLMLDEEDPRPAREQIDERYKHGGGWDPFKGFKFNHRTQQLEYPGDPPMRAMAAMRLRDELIILFEGEWTVILQRDGSFEVCRTD